jgi:single-strand DNA-binding protein
MNVVIVRGRLSRPPERRDLPSGDSVVAYEVTVERRGARAESVPVVWHGPPASAVDLEPETEIVAVGRVRRRFFRARGVTQSRTEVVADAVVPARQAKRVGGLARATIAAVTEAFLERPPG